MTRRVRGGVAALAVIAMAVVAAPSASVSAQAETRAAARIGEEGASGSASRARALVSEMSTAQQAASVVMGHIPVTDAATVHAYMAQGLGGFILMGSNIPASADELQALTAAMTVDPQLPPLIAIDQEGGLVSRLPDDGYTSSATLKTVAVEETRAAFSARASLVARAGITVNFGTVADMTADPSSFIHGRALGTDPQTAADRVAAATEAQEAFVASTLKHFPGHGAAGGDSHWAIPTTSMTLDQWRAADAVPFTAGIDAGASLLMFGHLAYTSVDSAPASLSSAWHRIAREDLGFDGVIVTDDLGMLLSSGDPAYTDPVANGVTALAAGNDLVLMIAGSTAETAGQIVAGIVTAVETGALSPERLEDAARRVLTLRLELSASTAAWSPCADCAPAG